MAAWDAQVSLAKFAVEHTHGCTYLMMMSHCRGFAMLSRKEALFSFLCLNALPCASPRLSPRLVLDFCLYGVRGLLLTKSEGASDLPISWKTVYAITSVGCTYLPPEFATLHHKGQRSWFLPRGVSAVLMRGWILHCKDCLLSSNQESQSRIVWFCTSPWTVLFNIQRMNDQHSLWWIQTHCFQNS